MPDVKGRKISGANADGELPEGFVRDGYVRNQERFVHPRTGEIILRPQPARPIDSGNNHVRHCPHMVADR